MSVKIHGKDYVTVAERVNEFHKKHPNGSIQTELVKFGDGIVVTKTNVYPDVSDTIRKFTGLAYEEIGSSQINKFSALENCETSSCGRAISFCMGTGASESIASADEVQNALHKQIYTVTDEQKERYQKYLKHHVFVGKKSDTNKWWAKFQTEEEAEKGLVKMLETINKYNEDKIQNEEK